MIRFIFFLTRFGVYIFHWLNTNVVKIEIFCFSFLAIKTKMYIILKKSGKLVIQELRRLEGTGQNLRDIIWKRSSLSASSPVAKSISM